MDPARLASRIRAIVNPSGEAVPPGLPARQAAPDLAVLDGEWRDGCFVVERRLEPSARHGGERIDQMAERLAGAAADAALLGATAAEPPFLFFDLETTGLSGGAGTLAFLVGCAGFDEEGGLTIRQFLLTRPADEPRLLTRAAEVFGAAGTLVSFNGKSFDAPVLETRYLFHRLDWVGRRLPHLDVLHPARRFWGSDPTRRWHDGSWGGRLAPTAAPAERTAGLRRGEAARPDVPRESCSLTSLETKVLLAPRAGDVPGFEIPARYFQFVRSGDAGPLAAVLEHNRLDLISLAALTARLAHLVRSGPAAARGAREALALGRTYARAGHDNAARAAFLHAADLCGRDEVDVRLESLRWRALLLRRARQYDEAASCWRAVLAVPECPAQLAREANEALAIHHEHRAFDLRTAKSYALKSLVGTRPAGRPAAEHRLARLDRKIGAATATRPPLLPS